MEYKTVNNLKIPQNLSPEKQALVDEIARNYIKQDKIINTDYMNNMARIGLGTGLSVASFLPVFNVPYVGTGLGGAMYDAGQAIVEGDKGSDIAKRAGRGFVIGETVGAVPYVGKAASKTKAGQAVGKQFDKVAEKVAANPAIQKAYDALMTDVKAFNPNKQTAYHGSPYDFEKFSNEAIGTGEGAQAHGYGHYAAKSKSVASDYADRLSEGNVLENVKINGREIERDPFFGYYYKGTNERVPGGNGFTLEAAIKQLYRNNGDLEKTIESIPSYDSHFAPEIINNLKNLKIEIAPNNKQLYKLSVPKDNVLLREGESFENQPEIVQKGLKNIKKDYLKSKGYNSIDEINAELDILSNQYENIVKNESPYDFYAGNKKSEIQAKISKLENLRRFNETQDLYNYLVSHQHLEPHEVSDLLYKQGIKGISYNGGIDGEARVIFNPDDIDIVRKYYNQPNLKDIYNKFINSGTFAGAITNP